MKKLTLLIILFSITPISLATEDKIEKPVQHLKLADITSLNEAENVFLEKTATLKSIKNFDPATLEKIHLITYSLEKSMAYYIGNLTGKNKDLAVAMAEQVERIHINSENSRSAATQAHLKQYLRLAQFLPLTR